MENAVMDEENNGLFLLSLHKLILHLSGNKKIVFIPAQSQDLPNNCTYNANATLRFLALLKNSENLSLMRALKKSDCSYNVLGYLL